MKIYIKMRIKQFIDNPMFIPYWIMRHFIYKKTSFKYCDKYKNIRQLSENETLKYIIQNNISIIRFGDGELGLLSGISIQGSNWSQNYSKELKNEMQRLLSIKNPNILVSVPPISHICAKNIFKIKDEYIYPNMHIESRMQLWRYLHKNQLYGSWSIFMNHINNESFDYKMLYDYIKNKNIIIVTGGDFSKISNIKLGAKTFYIQAPTDHAFEKRKQIFKDIEQFIEIHQIHKENTLFMISMGPTANAIVEHIANMGYTAWDTGHIFKYAEKEIKKFLENK